jgi:lia operon protein LiaF
MEVEMRNQGQVYLALFIILIGVLFLIGNLFDVDVGTFCWPTALILLGLWLLLRPQLISSDAAVHQKLLGDIRRRGAWQVTDEEIWLGIGDIRLDLAEAEIPVGETKLRVWNFVGSVNLRVPDDVGVSLTSTAFVSDVRMFGRKQEGILTPVQMSSENYETAERKVRLEITCFVADVRIRRADNE